MTKRIDDMDTELTPGDVVQIHPDQRALGGCFAVVTEVRGFGCIADVPVSAVSVAPVRLHHSEFLRIGKAAWTRSKTD